MAGAKWKARRTVKSASGTMWVAREAAGGGQHDPDDRYPYRPMRPVASAISVQNGAPNIVTRAKRLMRMPISSLLRPRPAQ